MVEPILAKGMGDIALAFRDRFGAGQPVVDVVGERLIGVGDIAFDLGLAPVEGIDPRQQPLFQNRARFGIEPGPKRVLATPKLPRFANLTRMPLITNAKHSHSHSIVPGGFDVTS